MDERTCIHEVTPCATCAGLHDPYEPPVRVGTDKVRHEIDPTEVVRILAQPASERGPAVTFTGQGETSTASIPTNTRWAPYVGGQRVSTTDRERRKLLAQGKRYTGPVTVSAPNSTSAGYDKEYYAKRREAIDAEVEALLAARGL